LIYRPAGPLSCSSELSFAYSHGTGHGSPLLFPVEKREKRRESSSYNRTSYNPHRVHFSSAPTLLPCSHPRPWLPVNLSGRTTVALFHPQLENAVERLRPTNGLFRLHAFRPITFWQSISSDFYESSLPPFLSSILDVVAINLTILLFLF